MGPEGGGPEVMDKIMGQEGSGQGEVGTGEVGPWGRVRGWWGHHGGSHHPLAVRGPALMLWGCLQLLHLRPLLNGMMQHEVGGRNGWLVHAQA